MQERLQKILAHAGIASRRKAEGLITEGHVEVNGKVVRELGTKADLDADVFASTGGRSPRRRRRSGTCSTSRPGA